MLIRRNWHPACNVVCGLPGFIGPFPSTLLMRSVIHCEYLFFNQGTHKEYPTLAILLPSILKKRKPCQGQRRHTFMYKIYIHQYKKARGYVHHGPLLSFSDNFTCFKNPKLALAYLPCHF